MHQIGRQGHLTEASVILVAKAERYRRRCRRPGPHATGRTDGVCEHGNRGYRATAEKHEVADGGADLRMRGRAVPKHFSDAGAVFSQPGAERAESGLAESAHAESE